MSKLSDTLGALKGIGSAAELRKLADTGYAPAARPKVNAHIHLPPNFSAFKNVGQAVTLAAEQGVKVLGVSNYYDYNVYGDFGVLARQAGVFPLFGLEIICMNDDLKAAGVKINDPGNPGKMYVCGKGITKLENMPAGAKAVLEQFRRNDVARVQQMVQATEKIFAERGVATGTTTDKVVDMVVNRHGCERSTVYLQERHVAQAFQEAAFAKTAAAERLAKLSTVFATKSSAKSADDFLAVQNDIRAQLLKTGKPAYVAEAFVSFPQAFAMIVGLGGIPVYPILADGLGGGNVCPFETPIDAFIENLRGRNIHATEFIPNRNDVQVLTAYTKALRAAGFIVTAGTEHNTLDLIGMEPVCKGNVPLPEELKTIYWEGACVIAAHQFLTLQGDMGFVDSQGNPNPNFADAEARIAALAKLGAAVIRRYFEKR